VTFSRHVKSLVLALLAGGVAVAVPDQETSWAVVVGVDNYQVKTISPLQFAASDARYLSQALQEKARIAPGHIFTLCSDESSNPSQAPTKANLSAIFQLLSKKVGPNDTLLFFYSGHGVMVQDHSFLVTPEADNRNLRTLAATSLDSQELATWMRRTGAKKIMLALDACRDDPSKPASGVNSRLAAVLERGVRPIARETSAQSSSKSEQAFATLFACQKEQSSYEHPSVGHGFFSFYLVEGLKGGAAKSDGRITLDSLASYVGAKVPEATVKAHLPRQTPWMQYEGPGQDLWQLAFTDPPKTSPSELQALQAEKQTLLNELNAIKKAADDRARQIQAELEQRVLQARRQGVEEGEALQEALKNKLEASQKTISQQAAQLAVMNTELDQLRAARQQSKMQLEHEAFRTQAEKTRLEADLRRQEIELNAKQAEQKRLREEALVNEAEAEACRLAALNRSSSGQPLNGLRKISYVDIFAGGDAVRGTTPFDLLRRLCDLNLVYEVGPAGGQSFVFDNPGSPLEAVAAKRLLDGKKTIAVEIPRIETSSNFTLEAFERPPTEAETVARLREGRSHPETVLISSLAELEQLNTTEQLTSLKTPGGEQFKAKEALRMFLALEGTRSFELKTEEGVIPAQFERNSRGELVQTAPAHNGLKYLLVRDTTDYSLEITRSKKVGGVDHQYVDRISAYEAANALLAGQAVTIRHLGKASTDVHNLAELRAYLSANRI
jgi:uncharacterized caspase-like protein